MIPHLRRPSVDFRSQAGVSLIELLVATAMMVVISGATVTMLTSVMQQTPKITKRNDQIGIARNAIEKISAEVRQGKSATSSGPSQMTLTTFCPSSGGAATPCTVSYSCAAESGKSTYACSRTVSGVTTKVTGGLASPEVFCFYPNTESAECGKASSSEPPRFVKITVRFPQTTATEAQAVLEGGAALHNSTSLLTR